MELLCLFLLFVVAGVFLMYAMAQYKARQYEEDRHNFELLVENLAKLEGKVNEEADNWPIYARPILFDKVDHEAQMEFAEAHKAIIGAEELKPQAESIRLPEYPPNSPRIFAIPQNLSTIRNSDHHRHLVDALAYHMMAIATSLKKIRESQKKVKEKRKEVEENIEKLQKRVDEIEIRLNLYEGSAADAIFKISWAIAQAKQGCQAAQAQIKRRSKDELEDFQGDLPYAIANVYVTLGEFLLGCFENYENTIKDIGRYELDEYLNFFDHAINELKKILEIPDINGWKKLKRAKPAIDAFPQVLRDAENSYHQFTQDRTAFEEKEKRLHEINWQEIIAAAAEVEKKCERYWPPYQERSDDWQTVLNKRVPPSMKLTQLWNQKTSDIDLICAPGVLIRQSDLQGLTKRITGMIEEKIQAERDIATLEAEFEKHKKAEAEALALTSEGGPVQEILTALSEKIKDTDPDIAQRGYTLIDTYNAYIKRLQRVRDANFPELVPLLRDCARRAEEILQAHRDKYAALEQEYRELKNRLEENKIRIAGFIRVGHYFAEEHVKMLRKAHEECSGLLGITLDGQYKTVNSLVAEMKKWLENNATIIQGTQDRLNSLKDHINEVENAFDELRRKIDNLEKYAAKKEGWLRMDMESATKLARNNTNVIARGWQHYVSSEWEELSYSVVIKICNDFLKDLGQVERELTNRIEMLNSEYSGYEAWSAQITGELEANREKIALSDIELIKKLCKVGILSQSREAAKKVLTVAQDLVYQPYDPKLRQTAQSMIFNFYDQRQITAKNYIEQATLRDKSSMSLQ